MHEVNVAGTRTLIDAAQAAGVTRVVASKRVVEGRFVPTFDVGVGCVDARDFADGVLLAAERGRPGPLRSARNWFLLRGIL
jgi:hypothetical protein